MYYGGNLSDFNDKTQHKTDADVIKDNHQFVWEEGEDSESWDKRLAKKYYDKLFKEYCLADLSRYKENKIAMRWRTENEVVAGKGQFVCGNKKCDSDGDLKSWEINFGYIEQEVKKNCLVKLRLCPRCSDKLNYGHKRKDVSKELKKLRAEVDMIEENRAGSSSKTGKGKQRQKRPEIAAVIDDLLF